MSIEITNMDEFKKELREHLLKSFKGVGLLVESEIRREVEKMSLMGAPPTLWQRGYHSYAEINGDKVELTIETGLPYAVYLEYGTYDYWSTFGLEGFPSTPLRKKKDSTKKQRDGMPKGMQPFAPIRRVMWNNQKMENILSKVLK